MDYGFLSPNSSLVFPTSPAMKFMPCLSLSNWNTNRDLNKAMMMIIQKQTGIGQNKRGKQKSRRNR